MKREEELVAPEDLAANEICEGGNLDCGSGLLLLIRKAMNQVDPGGILEIRSTEISVREDLPAWCRMTKNPYQGWRKGENHNKYFVLRGGQAVNEDKEQEKAKQYRWKCRIHWSGGVTSKVFCRNHSWSVGQPASFDISDDAPSAVEYVLGALGACIVQGFQIHASQRQVEIDNLEISLSGQIDNIFVFLGLENEGHSGFREIQGTLYVQSDEDEEIIEEIWQKTIQVSPLANTLTKSVSLNLHMRPIS